jgi:GT2 family glycosyltransferase
MAEPASPAVALVIPNFNGAELLRNNLPSVLAAAAAYPGAAEVIVVDDASKDASLAVLAADFPTVRRIAHGDNRGFAEAIRSGVEAAQAEWLVLLNSDVRPEPGFLAPLVRHLAEPEVFSVTPLVLDPAGRPLEESWRCYRLRGGRLRPVRRPGWVPARPVATLFNSGGSVALRKSRFLELGGFQPIFRPFYSEDADLGIRAWRRGWRNLLEPAARVVHDHTGSSIDSNVPSARVQAVRRRNRLLLEWMHLPARDLALRLVPGYAVQALGRLLRLDRVYFAGWRAALRRLPEALRLRAEVERESVLGFWEAMAAIERSAAEADAAERRPAA